MAEVVIDYAPRRWAVPFHKAFVRWYCLVLHRRIGKTTGTLNQHVRAAVDDSWERTRIKLLGPDFTEREINELLRERIYAHVLPSLTQARTVAWEKLKYITRDMPGAKPSERDMSIKLPAPKGHYRLVRLFGADNIDALRGFPLSGLSLDEFSQHPPGIFGEVLSKSLADHMGYGIFLGTIKGKNQLYQTYQAAKGDKEWFSLWQDIDVSLATEEGGTIKALKRAMEDDLKLIDKGLMTREEFDQEWYLSPFAAIKGAYYAKQLAEAHNKKRITKVPYDPNLPVFDVWDLGKGPNMSVGMFQRFGKAVQMIDYHEGKESDGLPQIIHELKEKPYVWGKHFAPHDIRATDISVGKTRLAVAEGLGWKFEVVPDIGVEDGINLARSMLTRTWIDETECSKFLEALGQYRRQWLQSKGIFGDKPEHDWSSHPADMWRYAAVVEDQMVAEPVRPRADKKPRPLFTGKASSQRKYGWMR